MSFLGDILIRHPDRAGSWPGENLVTDATRAVFRAVPELAHAFAREALKGDYPATVHDHVAIDIDSQQDQGKAGIVDLVLELQDEFVIWVEVKDRSGEHGDQMRKYAERLRERASPTFKTRLVYLTRDGAQHQHASHPLSWQRLADLVRAVEPPDERSRWLAQDYLDYLGELGLAMTAPMPTTGLRELSDQLRETVRPLQVLHARTRLRLEADWTPYPGHMRDGGALATWPRPWHMAFHAEPASSYPDARFELVLELSPEPSFHAGVLLDSRDRRLSAFDAAWHERMVNARDFTRSADGKRLHRVMPVTELVGSFAEQVDTLERFTQEAFSALRADPPSGPMADQHS